MNSVLALAPLGAEGRHGPPQGAGRDVEVFRQRRESEAGGRIQSVYGCRNLSGCQLAGTAKNGAAFAGGFHPGLGPLRNQRPLKLGERIADLIHALAHGRCGVELVREGQKLDAAQLELLKDIEGVAQGPERAVHFPDDKHIARRKRVQRRLKPRPHFTNRRNPLILEDAHTPGLIERIILKGQILIFRADTRVANSHQQTCTSRRPEQGCFGLAEDRQFGSILLGRGQVRSREFMDGEVRLSRGLFRVWPRRHKGTLLIGPFAVRSLKRFRRGAVSYPRRGKDEIGFMFVRLLTIGLCLLSLSAVPASAQTATPQELRYLDFTARNDGWAAAQSAAIIGSRDQHIVIVSFADPQTTRTFYDIALEFTRPPQALPIFGVVRAPQHPTEPNANGFDIYINGVSLGEVPNPDNAYTPAQFLRALLNNVRREYHPSGGG